MKLRHNRKIIYLAGFLFSMSIALTSYINSSFLGTFVNEDYVSIIYAIASIIAVFGLLKMPKIVTRLGNRLTILLFSFFIFTSLILLSLGNESFIVIPAFILYFTSISFVFSSLDIFMEDFSKKSLIGSLRGFYLMVLNLAWVIAQITSGVIISKSSFMGVYFLASGFMILVLFIFIFFLRDFKDPEYTKIPLSKTIKSFIKNKHLSKIYLINFILKFFYSWMVIYTPIYLHEYLGFGWEKIGIIFSIMLIPFIILDLPLGKLSDKMGEKKMLIMGFLIIIISVLIIPLITVPLLWLWAIILFSTRIGAATIEIMSEAYFFKVINEENANEIGFFRNTYSLSFIIGPLLAIPVLFLVPSFEYLFFILGVVLLFGLLIALRLKDVK